MRSKLPSASGVRSRKSARRTSARGPNLAQRMRARSQAISEMSTPTTRPAACDPARARWLPVPHPEVEDVDGGAAVSGAPVEHGQPKDRTGIDCSASFGLRRLVNQCVVVARDGGVYRAELLDAGFFHPRHPPTEAGHLSGWEPEFGHRHIVAGKQKG